MSAVLDHATFHVIYLHFIVLFQIFRSCTECVQPVEVVSYKIGVCKVSPRGKECRTEFERLSFNGKTSVVLCRPFTGRMHQIRVHLQYLGKRREGPSGHKNDCLKFKRANNVYSFSWVDKILSN